MLVECSSSASSSLEDDSNDVTEDGDGKEDGGDVAV